MLLAFKTGFQLLIRNLLQNFGRQNVNPFARELSTGMWKKSTFDEFLFRGHLKSSHIAGKRKNFHMALYPSLPPQTKV